MALLGTRPEVIKLAPVAHELRRRPEKFESIVASTGQHREMMEQARQIFDLDFDCRLDAMSAATSLEQLTSRLFRDVDQLLEREKPDWLLVQGDSTSALVGGMCAYYHKIKLGHVEAGLRTFDRWAPFPEEINRMALGHVGDLHFAPTPGAAENLLKAGVPPKQIVVTGNTTVDALMWTRNRIQEGAPHGLSSALWKVWREND